MQGITKREYLLKQSQIDRMLLRLTLEGCETKNVKELQEVLENKYKEYHALLEEVQDCIRDYEEICKQIRPAYNKSKLKKIVRQ